MLSGLASVVISNYAGRTSSQHNSHTFILIPGGSGIGKTRLGFELTRLPRDVVEARPGYADLSQVEQKRLLRALESPLYISLDFNNGEAFSRPVDTCESSIRLGVRVAARCLLGWTLKEISRFPLKFLAFTTRKVFHRLLQTRLSRLPRDAVLAVVVHIDEYQSYIDSMKVSLNLTFEEARRRFKELLSEIGWLMREAGRIWNLDGRFFFVPVCSGTSAIDVHFLRTEYPQHIVHLSPLSREDAMEMCAGRYSLDPLWSKVSHQNHFLVALGDTGTFVMSVELSLNNQDIFHASSIFFLEKTLSTPSLLNEIGVLDCTHYSHGTSPIFR